VGKHQIVPFAQQRTALLGEATAPFRQRAVRGVDRHSRLGGAHRWDVSDRAAGRGVGDRSRCAIVGRKPLPVDEAKLAQQGSVSEVHGVILARNDRSDRARAAKGSSAARRSEAAKFVVL
jgi:hypothetical protein